MGPCSCSRMWTHFHFRLGRCCNWESPVCWCDGCFKPWSSTGTLINSHIYIYFIVVCVLSLIDLTKSFGLLAVFGSLGQCRRVAGSIWLAAQGVASADIGVGMGMDKKCWNLERKSSYDCSATSVVFRSHYWKGIFAPVGNTALV